MSHLTRKLTCLFHIDRRDRFQRAALVTCVLTTLLFVSPAEVPAEYRITVTPTISITEEYTGNLFLSDEDEESDFITVISPGIVLDASSRSKGVSLSYSPGYSVYAKNSDDNTLRHSLSLNGWAEVSKTTQVRVFNRFFLTEDPLPDYQAGLVPDFRDASTEETEEAQAAVTETETLAESLSRETDTTRRTGRNTYYRNTSGISISRQIGKTDSLTADYAYSFLKNDDPDSEDSQDHNVALQYFHPFSRYLTMSTNAGYVRGIFEGDSDNFDEYRAGVELTYAFTKKFSGNVRYNHTYLEYQGESEDYHIFDPSVGVSYVWGEDFTTSLNVGYFYQDLKGGGDESGLTLDGNIGKTWGFKRGAVSLTGSSGYDQSYFGSENLGFNTYYQASGSANYAFYRSLSGYVFGSYRYADYPNENQGRTDQIATAGFGFNYQPQTIQWLSVGLSYTYSQTNSDVDENDFQEDRVFLNISIRPSTVYRLN